MSSSVVFGESTKAFWTSSALTRSSGAALPNQAIERTALRLRQKHEMWLNDSGFGHNLTVPPLIGTVYTAFQLTEKEDK